MIEVHVNHASKAGLTEDLVRRAVTAVVASAGLDSAMVSITFIGDHEIQALNRSYLGHDWPTDVLSFALDSEHGIDLVGDVYIGADRARAQAEDRGIAVLEEGVRLAVHGALHLVGKDHPEGPEREGSDFFLEQEEWVADLLAGGVET